MATEVREPDRPIAAGERDRRRRAPWWLMPLLGLVLLAALIAIIALSGSSGSDAALHAGSRSVDPGARLGSLVGQKVTATNVEVQRVDPGAGFWVGSSPRRSAWVEYGPVAGSDETRALPKVGDHVDLSGPVERPPRQPGRTFHISVASERRILAEGGYINADRIKSG